MPPRRSNVRVARADRQSVSRPLRILVTCEHGGHDVPPEYAALFRGHEALLRTHRGYDPGALAMARALAGALDAQLFTSTISRLLVELNRSPGRQFRESQIMRSASRATRAVVCERYYWPYWNSVEDFVRHAVARGERVVHVSSHSFTPSIDGVTMRAGDAGMLYDPARDFERRLCIRWHRALTQLAPQWVVRRNYPYRGTGDGLTRHLRTRFADRDYCGIELEINQKHVGNRGAIGPRKQNAVIAALRIALDAERDVARQRGDARQAPTSITHSSDSP